MNRRVLVILLIAFFIAAASAYLVFTVVSNRIAATTQAKSTVVVATTDVKIGTVLKDSDLRVTELASVPKGAIVRRQDAVGRGVISNLYQGEPVLENRLAAPGSGGGLASTIPPGMRACAIKVDDVVGVAGFVTPGMHVDVLISGNPPGAANAVQGTQVKTLMQNIEVLSAGTDIQRDSEGKPKQVQVVNLLVNPEQAEDLSLANSQTHIQLVLRNPLDTVISEPPGTAMGSLFGQPKAPPVAAPRPHMETVARPVAAKPVSKEILVQVYNGQKKSEAKFQGEDK